MDRQTREFATRQMQERSKEHKKPCNKYAEGGSAKIRKNVATSKGTAIKPRSTGRCGK